MRHNTRQLRDALVPGLLCKVTLGGKVFMLQYQANAGERLKPALSMHEELTVEQARSLAQNWLAEVRRRDDPGAAKTEARKAPTVKELCATFYWGLLQAAQQAQHAERFRVSRPQHHPNPRPYRRCST